MTLEVWSEKEKERRFIFHNTNTIALNNDSNKTQRGGLNNTHIILENIAAAKKYFQRALYSGKGKTNSDKLWSV